MKGRYRSAFEEALRDALARVPERERVLLRLHLVNGVTVDKIGKMFDVSQADGVALAGGGERDRARRRPGDAGRAPGRHARGAGVAGGLVASRLDLSLSLLLKTR